MFVNNLCNIIIYILNATFTNIRGQRKHIFVRLAELHVFIT